MPPARIALWVASVAGLAVAARSLVIAPIPMWAAVIALSLYTLFCTLGVLIPQLEMYGDVEWKGRAGNKRIALTFDDGPNEKTTRKVLAVLARRGHLATFFVVGRKARLHPDVVREIHEAGHWIGLHGYQHDRLYCLKPPRYVSEDIERTRRAIEEACGVRPHWFRPPIGYVSSRTASGAKKAGVRTVAWSVRSLDGLGGADSERVVERVEKRLADGAIVMLHDAAERDDFEPASVAALPAILDSIEERGLRTVSLEELLDGEAQAVEEAKA
jgi:peptidoglycan/xylan/chitin deacetylase (PgdA/CDA1 family)